MKIKMDALLESSSQDTLYNMHKSDFMDYFEEFKIFMLEKDPVLARITAKSLESISENVEFDHEFNIDSITRYRPDVIILNSNFSKDVTKEVTHIKNDFRLKNAGIICILGDKNSHIDNDLILKLSLEGVGEFIFEPVEQSELIAKIKTLLRIKYYHILLSSIPVFNEINQTKDSLTSLGNIAYFENQMNYLVQKSSHDEVSLHIVLIKITDAQYDGLPQLDILDQQLIAQLGKFVGNYCKSADLLGRYGKWYIACSYLGHSAEELAKVFENLQGKIRSQTFSCMSASRALIKARCDIAFTISERESRQSAKAFMQQCKIAIAAASGDAQPKELQE